jgi:hypothetical protein
MVSARNKLSMDTSWCGSAPVEGSSCAAPFDESGAAAVRRPVLLLSALPAAADLFPGGGTDCSLRDRTGHCSGRSAAAAVVPASAAVQRKA